MVTLDSLHALLEHEVMVTMVFDCSVTVETGPVGVSVAGADDSGALDSGADDSEALDSGVVSGAKVTEVESTLEGTGVVSVNGQKVV